MITAFTLRLSAGITLMWLMMPRKQVTDGFFRIQMLVLLGLTVLCSLLLSATNTPATVPRKAQTADTVAITSAREVVAESAEAPGMQSSGSARSGSVWAMRFILYMQVAAAAVAWFGHVFWKLSLRRPGTVAIYLLFILTVGSVALSAAASVGAGGIVHQAASDFASAAVLGATLTSMLLGHWYLTTPTMSIQPLWWFNRTLFSAAVMRMAVTGVAVIRFDWPLTDLTHTLWFVLRVLGTIVVPVIAAWLVWKILKFRNTQSATGVLFAALILVFMGEMTASLLTQDTGLPY